MTAGKRDSSQLKLGIGALAIAAFLVLFAIPSWISSPSNVKNIVLSPVFWPNAIAAFTGLVGLGLVATHVLGAARSPGRGPGRGPGSPGRIAAPTGDRSAVANEAGNSPGGQDRNGAQRDIAGQGQLEGQGDGDESGTVRAAPDSAPAGVWIRLVALAGMCLAIMLLVPILGMVWTSMIAFAAVAFLLRTPRPVVAGVAAVLVPLVLYAFFVHVSGVAIPQGMLVRLP